MKKIRVLIVEDSPVAQEFLTYILMSDPDIEVVGVAKNGSEALELVKELRPSVITMDIHMPIMDGFEATRRIMESVPTPIVVVSGSTGAQEVASTFRAMEAGALAVVLRPTGINHAAFKADSKRLIVTVKLMSEIKVVRRIARQAATPMPKSAILSQGLQTASGIQVIAIGASTGGPPVLKEILSRLRKDFPFPIIIVQHIAAGFVGGFAAWLSGSSDVPVRIASHGELPLPGRGYMAPDGFYIGVAEGPRIALSDDPPECNGLRPSVAYLFRSAAKVLGPRAVGVLLTGMGRDGAEEMKMMKDRGAITIAQDEASSVVHGMPGEAIKLGGATYVLPPEGIAATLSALKAAAGEEAT
ncbi:MAG: chemotaxis-specific protein-glutamate methyltransferase CheB [Rectinemataceae bacterium]|jgi:two-component system chemotaxis response regulator CheB